MPLVLATPPVSPPAEPSQWGTVGMVWVGPDGSRWNLNDWRGGLQLVRDGVKGLHFPKISKSKSVSRSVPGFRLRGFRAESRDVFWPLYVYGDGSDEWRRVYDAFFATITPDRAGVWEVTAGHTTRRLQLTGVFDEEFSFTRDPLRKGWAIIPVSLEPENPFWMGDAVTTPEFGGEEPVDFIPSDPGDPDYHPSPAATFSAATINNPGHVEAYLTWTVRALDPVDAGDVILGLGGVTAQINIPMAAGDVLVIDTDPRNVAALLNGVDVTAQLGLVEWAPLPSGVDVPLTVIGPAASATVQASMVPLFYTAF